MQAAGSAPTVGATVKRASAQRGALVPPPTGDRGTPAENVETAAQHASARAAFHAGPRSDSARPAIVAGTTPTHEVRCESSCPRSSRTNWCIGSRSIGPTNPSTRASARMPAFCHADPWLLAFYVLHDSRRVQTSPSRGAGHGKVDGGRVGRHGENDESTRGAQGDRGKCRLARPTSRAAVALVSTCSAHRIQLGHTRLYRTSHSRIDRESAVAGRWPGWGGDRDGAPAAPLPRSG
jgi:hypothetical protein